jgi:hypothetical protein
VKPSGAIVAALLVLLLAAGAVLSLVPRATCPDCRGNNRGKEAFHLGCPRCADRGSVSLLNRWTRADLDPDLAVLLSVPGRDVWYGPDPAVPALRRLLGKAGRESLRLAGAPRAAAVWLDDGDEPRVAAYTASDSGEPWAAIFLFDSGGRLLDELFVFGADRPLSVNENDRMKPSGRSLEVGYLGSGPHGPLRVLQGELSRTLPPEGAVVRLRSNRLEIEPGKAPK